MGHSRAEAYACALYLAAKLNQTDLAIESLELLTSLKKEEGSARYDCKDAQGLSPIFFAIRHKNLRLIQALITNDPRRLTQQNKNKEMPIEFAVRRNAWECVTVIANTQSSIAKANYGTALVKAMSLNQKDTVIALIKAGAPDGFFEGGWTALHWAVHYNDPKIIKILLDAGYDPYIKSRTKNEEKPSALAARLHYTECAMALTYKPKQPAGLESKNVSNQEVKENHLEKITVVDELCAVALREDLLTFRSLLRQPKYNYAINQYGSEGLTLMEYLAIYEKWDMLVCALEYDFLNVKEGNYTYNEDATRYIMGPTKIADLLEIYNESAYNPLIPILNSLHKVFPQNYKTLLEELNPYNVCLIDSYGLNNLILNIAQEKLQIDTLGELAKKQLFKETVLSYLKGLFELKKYDMLDEILLSNKNKKGLEKFFGIKRGLAIVSITSGTLMHFINLQEKWHKGYELRKAGKDKVKIVEFRQVKENIPPEVKFGIELREFKKTHVGEEFVWDSLHYTTPTILFTSQQKKGANLPVMSSAELSKESVCTGPKT